MNQIGPTVDAKLNKASVDIGAAKALIEQKEKELAEVWELVFNLFDEGSSIDRFVASDGYTLVRQWSESPATIDEARLKEDIFAAYDSARATRIWNDITDRRVNRDKLSHLVVRGRLDSALVAKHIGAKGKRASRVRREWTKEDKEKAAIFGIELKK